MSNAKAKKTATRKKSSAKEKIGGDGTIVQTRRLRSGSSSIVLTHKVRVRTGGFEWRYGRIANARYHAGSEFARLWERAGIASASAAAIDGTAGGSGWSGLPEGRMAALDRVRAINARLGGGSVHRLVAYVVEGRTPREIATGYPDFTDRAMSSVLDMDLLQLSEVMGYAR